MVLVKNFIYKGKGKEATDLDQAKALGTDHLRHKRAERRSQKDTAATYIVLLHPYLLQHNVHLPSENDSSRADDSSMH